MAAKNLESASSEDSQEGLNEIKAGVKVKFIAPSIFSGKARRLQYRMIRATNQFLGPGPYVVKKIERYDDKSTAIEVEGRNGKTKFLDERYLVKC